jgi:hypothetical protein
MGLVNGEGIGPGRQEVAATTQNERLRRHPQKHGAARVDCRWSSTAWRYMKTTGEIS